MRRAKTSIARMVAKAPKKRQCPFKKAFIPSQRWLAFPREE
jgi:hypothetical protein